MNALKEYKIAGYSVRLYPNRIEQQWTSILGKRVETILLKSVTNVACGLASPIEVTTTDGKKHRLNIGGRAAEEWRKAILDVMT